MAKRIYNRVTKPAHLRKTCKVVVLLSPSEKAALDAHVEENETMVSCVVRAALQEIGAIPSE